MIVLVIACVPIAMAVAMVAIAIRTGPLPSEPAPPECGSLSGIEHGRRYCSEPRGVDGCHTCGAPP